MATRPLASVEPDQVSERLLRDGIANRADHEAKQEDDEFLHSVPTYDRSPPACERRFAPWRGVQRAAAWRTVIASRARPACFVIVSIVSSHSGSSGVSVLAESAYSTAITEPPT